MHNTFSFHNTHVCKWNEEMPWKWKMKEHVMENAVEEVEEVEEVGHTAHS